LCQIATARPYQLRRLGFTFIDIIVTIKDTISAQV